MNNKLTTQEEIQALFDTMANQKASFGLSRQQAETVSIQQIAQDAKVGEIDEAAAKEFVTQYKIANGSTAEVADLEVSSLFAPLS